MAFCGQIKQGKKWHSISCIFLQSFHQISSLNSNKHGNLNNQGWLADFFLTSQMKKWFKEGGLFCSLHEVHKNWTKSSKAINVDSKFITLLCFKDFFLVFHVTITYCVTKAYFGEKLLLEKPLEAPDNALPSPRQLFGKIILKHKKLATPLELKSATATTAASATASAAPTSAATSDSATAALPANNGNLNGREVPPTPPTSLAFTSTQKVLYTKAI